MTSNAEEQANTPAAATGAAAESHQTQRYATEARVTPSKPRSEKKASSVERRPKSQKAAKQAKPDAGVRGGTKAPKYWIFSSGPTAPA